MKLINYFAGIGLSNVYVMGPKEGGNAILVDPSVFDVALLERVENNGFNIAAVLITHNHFNHLQGLKTIMRIYSPLIYAYEDKILDFPTTSLRSGDKLKIFDFQVEAVVPGGHTPDSLCYIVQNCIFTGDTMSAGRLGTTRNERGRLELIKNINEMIMTKPGEYLIFPGHGPPSTVASEIHVNEELKEDTSVIEDESDNLEIIEF